MSKFSFILIIIVLFYSCKKDKQGKVSYNIRFTTEELSLKKNSDTLYTQFGDYITSLTPIKFTSAIWTIGYTDGVGWQDCNALQYIEQNGEKLLFSDPKRIVDFSGNNTISFQPVIYGNLDEDHNTFATPQVDFIYFYFIPFYFYQEVVLPSQYREIYPEMFPIMMDPNPAIFNGDTLKVKHYQMVKKVLPDSKINNLIYYIFGNCDSTFVVNPESQYVGLSEDCPVADAKNDLVIRSDKYVNMIYNSPYNGESTVMNGTLSMNITNLIQVYAGADNIAYTGDDIFVYAPNYWERLKAKLETN